MPVKKESKKLKKMKKTSVLINVGRGPIVSEEDLVWALENNEGLELAETASRNLQ